MENLYLTIMNNAGNTFPVVCSFSLQEESGVYVVNTNDTDYKQGDEDNYLYVSEVGGIYSLEDFAEQVCDYLEDVLVSQMDYNLFTVLVKGLGGSDEVMLVS